MSMAGKRYYGEDVPLSTGPHPDPIQGAIDDAVAIERERCAKIAESHKGSAARKRRSSGQKLSSFGLDSADEILCEERGEDIAAEMIAAAIRKPND